MGTTTRGRDTNGTVAETVPSTSVLYFGRGVPPTFVRGPSSDLVVVVGPTRYASIQLGHRFDMVYIDDGALVSATAENCRALLHAAAQHLAPEGVLAIARGQDGDTGCLAGLCDEFALVPPSGVDITEFDVDLVATCDVFRRQSPRFTVHDLVHAARSTIRRLDARRLFEQINGSAPPTIIDTRTNTDRERFGVISGAVHVPRTVLEWHLDPSSGYRHPSITSMDQTLVVVCNGGYSSSLAAANLAQLGFTDVADLVGGHQAWIDAGFPVVRPDHSALDF